MRQAAHRSFPALPGRLFPFSIVLRLMRLLKSERLRLHTYNLWILGKIGSAAAWPERTRINERERELWNRGSNWISNFLEIESWRGKIIDWLLEMSAASSEDAGPESDKVLESMSRLWIVVVVQAAVKWYSKSSTITPSSSCWAIDKSVEIKGRLFLYISLSIVGGGKQNSPFNKWLFSNKKVPIGWIRLK